MITVSHVISVFIVTMTNSHNNPSEGFQLCEIKMRSQKKGHMTLYCVCVLWLSDIMLSNSVLITWDSFALRPGNWKISMLRGLHQEENKISTKTEQQCMSCLRPWVWAACGDFRKCNRWMLGEGEGCREKRILKYRHTLKTSRLRWSVFRSSVAALTCLSDVIVLVLTHGEQLRLNIGTELECVWVWASKCEQL